MKLSALAALPAVLAAAVPLSGCSSEHDYGSVAGIAAPCVGAARPGTTSVTVYARLNGRVVKSIKVVLTRSPGNPYHMRLPAGTYELSAPRSDLPARTINIRPHTTVVVDFRPSCK